MNPFYKILLKTLIPLGMLLIAQEHTSAQACPAAAGDDQSVYGTNGVWIGYIYTGTNFNNYQGHVTEGATGAPNFYENFGGSSTTFNTSGCSITTDGFSARYRLSQSFTGSFTITVGGDDGYRLSIDGGNTWIINNWGDHGYTTTSADVTLSGMTNFVLEYYENAGDNIVSFSLATNCIGTGDPTIYGTGNVWRGYIYKGMNFDSYKGFITEGSAGSPNFDENFGNPSGSNTNTFTTSSCTVTTYQFSARYRLTQTLPAATYSFTVGGDDGYRFSLDGGNTWVINNWGDHGYTTTNYSAALSGSYNMVLEYYQNGGGDEVSFQQVTAYSLPVTLTSWSVTALDKNQALLNWTTTDAVNFDHFVVQRSTDGSSFDDIQTIAAVNDGTSIQSYNFTGQDNWNGRLYYRLALVDRDGTTRYSTIQSLSLQQAQSVRIYPTQVDAGSFFVETTSAVSEARLEIFDMSGRRLQENAWSLLNGRQSVTLGKSASLPAGAYIARLSDGRNVLAKQILIIKSH